MNLRDEAESWRRGLRPFDDAFAAAAARVGESLPCRRGCSACCESAGLFEIHAPDVALLRQGLGEIGSAARERILARAAVVASRARLAARELARDGEPRLEDWEPTDGLGALGERQVERLADALREACPVLDGDGSCALHAWRPAICRLQGLAWSDPETSDTLPDFCALESRSPDLPAAEAPLHALDELREQLRARLERGGECGRTSRTFVAAALLGSPSDPLRGDAAARERIPDSGP